MFHLLLEPRALRLNLNVPPQHDVCQQPLILIEQAISCSRLQGAAQRMGALINHTPLLLLPPTHP
jgi:hypothetical protein